MFSSRRRGGGLILLGRCKDELGIIVFLGILSEFGYYQKRRPSLIISILNFLLCGFILSLLSLHSTLSGRFFYLKEQSQIIFFFIILRSKYGSSSMIK